VVSPASGGGPALLVRSRLQDDAAALPGYLRPRPACHGGSRAAVTVLVGRTQACVGGLDFAYCSWGSRLDTTLSKIPARARFATAIAFTAVVSAAINFGSPMKPSAR
jgi:hypothetical protein